MPDTLLSTALAADNYGMIFCQLSLTKRAVYNLHFKKTEIGMMPPTKLKWFYAKSSHTIFPFS